MASKIETVAVTEAQAARALSIPKDEVRKLVVRGELDGRMVGNQVIVSVESVRRFVEPEEIPEKENAGQSVAHSDRRKPEVTEGSGRKDSSSGHL